MLLAEGKTLSLSATERDFSGNLGRP